MSLDEVINALAAVGEGDVACVDERWRLEVVIKRVDDEVSRLLTLRANVERALAGCDAGDCVAGLQSSYP